MGSLTTSGEKTVGYFVISQHVHSSAPACHAKTGNHLFVTERRNIKGVLAVPRPAIAQRAIISAQHMFNYIATWKCTKQYRQ